MTDRQPHTREQRGTDTLAELAADLWVATAAADAGMPVPIWCRCPWPGSMRESCWPSRRTRARPVTKRLQFNQAHENTHRPAPITQQAQIVQGELPPRTACAQSAPG
jgi:hypothetical protein